MATTTNNTSFSQPVFYVGVSIAAVLLAAILDAFNAPSAEEMAVAEKAPPSVEENIKPIGTIVLTGEEKAVAVAVADTGPRSGADVYKAACLACHSAGVSGAPKLEAGAWDDRIAKGLEALVSSAINGIGMMPARGGNASLSDEDIRNAVIYMTAESGYELEGAADSKAETSAEAAPAEAEADTQQVAEETTTEPKAETATEAEPVAQKEETEAAETAEKATQTVTAGIDGEKIYKGLCFSCHDSGLANAPKLGDKAAWEPRIAAGKLYENSINGIGIMPAKGGNTALTDDEIKATVDWMIAQ